MELIIIITISFSIGWYVSYLVNKKRLINYLIREQDTEWNKMGDTGNEKYSENFNDENYHFGRFRAFEDLESDIKNDLP